MVGEGQAKSEAGAVSAQKHSKNRDRTSLHTFVTWIYKLRDDLCKLQKAARPAMCDQQGDCILVL